MGHTGCGPSPKEDALWVSADEEDADDSDEEFADASGAEDADEMETEETEAAVLTELEAAAAIVASTSSEGDVSVPVGRSG